MQVAQRLGQRHLIELAAHHLGQQFFQRVFVQPGQCLHRQRAQARLGQAFGGGVNRGERLFQRQRRGAIQLVVFGVVHLQTRGSTACLTKNTQACALHQPLFLRIVEVIKTQGNSASAVLHLAYQTAALAKYHVAGAHLRLQHRIDIGL